MTGDKSHTGAGGAGLPVRVQPDDPRQTRAETPTVNWPESRPQTGWKTGSEIRPATLQAAAPSPAGDSVYTHRGTRAVQRLVEYAPSTGGLALWAHHRDLPDAAPGPGPFDTQPALASPVERRRQALEPDQAAPPVAVVFTDGHTVFYSVAFERLTLPVQAGWVAHEMLHIALRHTQRYTALRGLLGDCDLALYNVCADAVVNSALGHLGWLEMAPQAVTLEALLQQALGVEQTAEAALLEWDVERLYRAVDDRRALPDPGRQQRKPGQSSQSADGDRKQGRTANGRGNGSPASAMERADPGACHLPNRPGDAGKTGEPSAGQVDGGTAGESQGRTDGPRAAAARSLGRLTACDLSPAPDAAPQDEAEHARGWAERLSRAHANDGAHSLLRALLADLPHSRVPWEQVLRTVLARSLAPQSALSWSRPSRSWLANQGRIGGRGVNGSTGSRRMPWEPGTTASRAVPRLVVVVDVSGSIEEALMARFAREIEALTRRLGAALVLVIGDDRVRDVVRCEPGRSTLRDMVFKGGGGTDFTPLLQEADRHRPDIGIVLTDLEGPAHFRPRWPVVWALPPAQAHAVPPFGRTLLLR